jgi:hypothetical protein
VRVRIVGTPSSLSLEEHRGQLALTLGELLEAFILARLSDSIAMPAGAPLSPAMSELQALYDEYLYEEIGVLPISAAETLAEVMDCLTSKENTRQRMLQAQALLAEHGTRHPPSSPPPGKREAPLDGRGQAAPGSPAPKSEKPRLSATTSAVCTPGTKTAEDSYPTTPHGQKEQSGRPKDSQDAPVQQAAELQLLHNRHESNTTSTLNDPTGTSAETHQLVNIPCTPLEAVSLTVETAGRKAEEAAGSDDLSLPTTAPLACQVTKADATARPQRHPAVMTEISKDLVEAAASAPPSFASKIEEKCSRTPPAETRTGTPRPSSQPVAASTAKALPVQEAVFGRPTVKLKAAISPANDDASAPTPTSTVMPVPTTPRIPPLELSRVSSTEEAQYPPPSTPPAREELGSEATAVLSRQRCQPPGTVEQFSLPCHAKVAVLLPETEDLEIRPAHPPTHGWLDGSSSSAAEEPPPAAHIQHPCPAPAPWTPAAPEPRCPLPADTPTPAPSWKQHPAEVRERAETQREATEEAPRTTGKSDEEVKEEGDAEPLGSTSPRPGKERRRQKPTATTSPAPTAAAAPFWKQEDVPAATRAELRQRTLLLRAGEARPVEPTAPAHAAKEVEHSSGTTLGKRSPLEAAEGKEAAEVPETGKATVKGRTQR